MLQYLITMSDVVICGKFEIAKNGVVGRERSRHLLYAPRRKVQHSTHSETQLITHAYLVSVLLSREITACSVSLFPGFLFIYTDAPRLNMRTRSIAVQSQTTREEYIYHLNL